MYMYMYACFCLVLLLRASTVPVRRHKCGGLVCAFTTMLYMCVFAQLTLSEWLMCSRNVNLSWGNPWLRLLIRRCNLYPIAANCESGSASERSGCPVAASDSICLAKCNVNSSLPHVQWWSEPPCQVTQPMKDKANVYRNAATSKTRVRESRFPDSGLRQIFFPLINGICVDHSVDQRVLR